MPRLERCFVALNLEQLAVNPDFKLLHNRYPQLAIMVLILSGNGKNGVEVVSRIIVV
ncbi:MAG: hypothetical protein QW837_01555 [Conexivisphaerales archaeon]